MLESPLFLVQAVSLVLFVGPCLDLLRLRRKWRADDARRISNEVVHKLTSYGWDVPLIPAFVSTGGAEVTVSIDVFGKTKSRTFRACRAGTVIGAHVSSRLDIKSLIYK